MLKKLKVKDLPEIQNTFCIALPAGRDQEAVFSTHRAAFPRLRSMVSKRTLSPG